MHRLGLHGQERVRFMRASGEMLSLLRTRTLHGRPAPTWVVCAGERTAGDLCVSGPDERTEPGVLVAREIAGSRPAVLAAASAILDALDAEMTSLARSFGCATRSSGMHGTLKIMDPPAFFEALKPRLLARLSPAAEDLSALVFGSVERESRGILRSVFPLPLPGYGLSYV